jgi:hypothetical protein
MADDSDALFGFILFILFLALIGYAAGGGSWPSTTTTGTPTSRPTTTYTTRPYSTPTSATDRYEGNIPGGPLESCPGKIVANKSDTSDYGSVNVKLYYSEENDRNCVVATRYGWADKTQGRLTARLRFSDYDGNQWPESAVVSSQPHTSQIGGAYLDDTYNRCVTASATFEPFTGMDKVSVSTGAVGCN